MFPAIRGVQDHMSNWMSSLIQAQDGCLQMVAHRASMGRFQQEQLAHHVAQRAMMPSTTDQVSYLRAQLAHRDAQLEQVRAERDNHFVQDEKVLAHMRLLSSEAKDWKSRIVTEAEEVLCRESAQVAHQATEAQEAMDQHYKAKWRQAETDLKALCQSNSAQVQSLASKLQETNLEHHELHTAQERQLRLEAQALRQAQEQEQQAAQVTHEHELAIQEFRRQAEEQPELHKLLWRRQLSQQSTYKAEIHELYTEMLNMREKSEMQSHLSAHMCKLEHTSPSGSLESEPDNVLNTASPSRSSAWILRSKMATPDRPTSSGLQSPSGAPMQFGPNPQTQEYSRPSPCCVSPARWGNHYARESGEEECELFGVVPPDQEENPLGVPAECEAHQDELYNASSPSVSNSMASNLAGPRCIDGQLVRPTPPSDASPSTACQASTVCAPGGVPLGKAPPGFGSPTGIVPSRRIPPPPPPPAPVQPSNATVHPLPYPVQCTPLHTKPRRQEEAVHQKVQAEEQGREQVTSPIHPAIHTQEEEEQGPMAQEEDTHQEEDPPVVNQTAAVPFHVHHHLQVPHLRSNQEEQAIQAVLHRPHLQSHLHQVEQSTHGRL